MSEANNPTMHPIDAEMQAQVKLLRPKAAEPQMVPCFVPETGESFTAEVQPSKTYPGGRVVKLHNYDFPGYSDPKLPVEVHEAHRQQHKYEQYKACLRAYVGKPLPRALRVDFQDAEKKSAKKV